MTSLSPLQKARFATASRLLACAINEGLVKALYKPNTNLNALTDKKLISGFILVLPEGDQDLTTNDEIVIIPMIHKPIIDEKYESNNRTSVKIEFVDPWDMSAPICKIGYHDFHLSGNSELGQEIEPSYFMRMLGIWRNLDRENVKLICAELDSSVKYQEYTYKLPCPTPSLLSSSIEWEQSLIEGHALHPMHKARYAISPIPEILPDSYDFQKPLIRFVEVPREKVILRGLWAENVNILIDSMSRKPTCSPDTILFPVHELQLPNILEKFPYVKVLPSEYSIQASSQASLRTIVIPTIPEISIKLPLGIKVSSALRTITPWTTYIATGLAPILEKLDIDRNVLKIANEVASGVSVESNYDIAKHLSCIFRRDFNDRSAPQEKTIICAALLERDYDGISFVQKVWRLDTEDKSCKFLERYSELLLRAFLPPTLTNGFAFEAHAQNVLARFDSTGEHLIGFVVRDFGGIRHHQETLFASTGQYADVLKGNATEAKDLLEVYKRFYHTVILCHLHRLVRALKLHHSGVGWKIIRRHLSEMIPHGHALKKLLLEEVKLPIKCFLRMKMDGLYRDYIYRDVPNIILYKGEDESAAK